MKKERFDRSFLHQKYTVERLSMSQIARISFSSSSVVHRYLKHYDILIRKQSSNTSPRKGCGLAYGEKIINRRKVAHKRELENIAKMKDLREKGYKLREIAEVLNTMGIPTQTGKAKWCPKKVQQILLANTD